MSPITIMVDVPDRAIANPAEQFRRVAALAHDNTAIVVATMVAGEANARHEHSYQLGYAAALAEACLSGDRRALTTPGLARILSSAVAVLFRVSLAAGSIQREDDGHDSNAGDRREAAPDED